MDSTRRRFGSLLEWMCAAGFAVGGVLVLSMAFDNLRSVPAVVPVIAKEAPDPDLMGGIPAGVARVPLLLLTNHREVHIGDRLRDLTERLGSAAELVSESVQDVASGRRITQFYADGGVQFIVVLDAAGREPDPRVSAIFIR